MSSIGQRISALLLLTCIAFFSSPRIYASSQDPLTPCHRHSRPFRTPNNHQCCFVADRHALPAHVDLTPAPAEVRSEQAIHQPISQAASSLADGHSHADQAIPIVTLRI